MGGKAVPQGRWLGSAVVLLGAVGAGLLIGEDPLREGAASRRDALTPCVNRVCGRGHPIYITPMQIDITRM